MSNYLKPIILLLAVSITLFSCHKSGKEDFSNLSESQRKNIVPIGFAKALASKYTLQMAQKSSGGALRKGTEDTGMVIYPEHDVDASYTINDKNNIPALYLFTYGPNNGFCVVSADLRYDPVCAYVPEGDCHPEDSVAIPPTLYGWFYQTIETIENIRDNQFDNTGLASFQWCRAIENTDLAAVMANYGLVTDFNQLDAQSNVNGYTYRKVPVQTPGGGGGGGGNPCGSNSSYSYGPLLTTSWDQGCYYNNQCPSCSGGYYCGKMLTGCVATAMAQVLKFVNKTCSNTGCNYAAMPNSLNGSSSGTAVYEVSRLMKLCGNSVSMNWGCSSSGASRSSIPGGFSSYFCVYSSITSYNQNTIVSNMNARHNPVILAGCSDRHIHGWLIHWYTYDNCHAWVCDGYQGTKNNCNFQLEKFHMNWGWGGSYNGWYSVSAPYTVNGGMNFQYSNEMIYDIH